MATAEAVCPRAAAQAETPDRATGAMGTVLVAPARADRWGDGSGGSCGDAPREASQWTGRSVSSGRR